jgi:hypothetical protein
LPKEQRFSAIGWWLGKGLRLYGQHELLYSESSRRKQLRLLILAMFVLWACAGILLFTWPPAA